MSGYEKDLRAVMDRAQVQGFRIRQTEKSHWQFFAPDPKNGIILASHSSVSRKGWRHFMALMKKAGYKEHDVEEKATTSLGEALAAARASHTPPAGVLPIQPALPKESGPPRGTLTNIVVDFIQHSERIVTRGEVLEQVEVRMGKGQTIDNTLHRLKSQGRIVKMGEAAYQWATKQPEKIRRNSARVHAPPPKEARKEAATAYADPDIQKLDEALAALAQIADVVNNYKKRIQDFNEKLRIIQGMGGV